MKSDLEIINLELANGLTKEDIKTKVFQSKQYTYKASFLWAIALITISVTAYFNTHLLLKSPNPNQTLFSFCFMILVITMADMYNIYTYQQSKRVLTLLNKNN